MTCSLKNYIFAPQLINKIKNGDLLRLDCHTGRLELLVKDELLQARSAAQQTTSAAHGMGRELFSNMRHLVSSAELGASICS